MAAAAILNLLLLFILVKCSISASSRLHYCKISLIYVNQQLRYCCLCKKCCAHWMFIDVGCMSDNVM